VKVLIIRSKYAIKIKEQINEEIVDSEDETAR